MPRPDGPSRGPWGDLPPPEPPQREPIWRRPRRRGEPIVRNWRGLAVIAFLIFVAPILARWASQVLIGLVDGWR